MIITTGILKFKRISTIKNNNLRPTSNKVRQAIFNVLKHKFEMDAWKKKSCMLDAFAGTGIVALEALSRGFVNTTLVEKDIKNFKKLEENIINLNISQKVKLINDDFFNIKNFPYKYKLVYLDPPYYKNLINLALEKVFDFKILEKKSIIICETEKDFNFEDKIQNYTNFSKTYGAAKLTFLQYT